MVNKKIATRDYLRAFITRANKEAGVTFNASKLNSKEECEKYLLNLIKDLRHKVQPTKIKNSDIIQENDNLKDKVKRLEAEQMFYITQAEEAKKTRNLYKTKMYDRLVEATEKIFEFRKKLALSNFLLTSAGIFIVLELIVIMLLLRGV